MEKQAIKQILLDQREEIKKIFIKIIEREIEESTDNISAYEFKWKNKKSVKEKAPKAFSDKYKNINFKIINRKNYQEFLKI
ncbi:MAG: hypothetical protein KJ770_05950 [Actinobacteria bacterium]|nr:hypothetical protein [Actinomycetota bacterium]MBU4449788.1 hypothetical protein [Actinomycetota bacterium]